MKEIARILDRIGQTLVGEVAPALEGQYVGGKAGLSGLMAIMAGEAFDGAADRLSREIEAMKSLLQAGGDEAAAQIAPASLKLSDLDVARDALAARLISLQADLETRGDPDARALNTQIWQLLLAAAVERMPSPPEFPDPPEAPTASEAASGQD
ncbi:MAG: hypothetical protein AAGH87_05575 [Pseudomonadota bacterium]